MSIEDNNRESLGEENHKNSEVLRLFKEVLVGLPIFLIPLFTFLSPANLKQLASGQISPILISLSIFFVFLFICYHFTYLTIKKLHNKSISGLFPVFCFGFYLLFFHESTAGYILSNIHNEMLFSRILSLIILFVLWIIIIIASIYSNLIIRLIFIYSILIIINSSFLIAKFNYDKYSHVNNEYELLNETKKHLLIQNKKRNIYFVLMDEMTSINEAIKLGVLETASVIKEIEKTGLRYIPNSLSSYNLSYLTLASIFNLDYPVTSKSNQYFDRTYFFPNLLTDEDIDVPLLSYLNLVNSKLYWIGNIWASCIENTKVDCVDNSLSVSLLTFYRSTPLDKTYFKLVGAKNFGQDTIKRYLDEISQNGLPEELFFVFIHHFSPHPPYSFTRTCQSPDTIKVGINGYKDSYYCALKRIDKFMHLINKLDPEAIIIIQGDHGWHEKSSDKNEEILTRGKIFNAIKAPKSCFEKFGEPKTNPNSVRFALNCAYGYDLNFHKNIHYQAFYESEPEYGFVYKQKIY